MHMQANVRLSVSCKQPSTPAKQRDSPHTIYTQGIILMDQFSRNVYRNTPATFALDGKALAWARQLWVGDVVLGFLQCAGQVCSALTGACNHAFAVRTADTSAQQLRVHSCNKTRCTCMHKHSCSSARAPGNLQAMARCEPLAALKIDVRNNHKHFSNTFKHMFATVSCLLPV